MGRPRKSTAEHVLSGAFERHPERKAERANEPKPDGPLGEPPACFDPQSRTGQLLICIWHELIAQAPAGVLTSADRLWVELACRALHLTRTGCAKSADRNLLLALLGRMGMNPADRSKVNIAPGNAQNSIDERAGRKNIFEELAGDDDDETVIH
jgi:hypothetical protein